MSTAADSAPLPRVDLINLDSSDFEGLPFVLTSPRSLEACRRLGLEPVSLLAQSADSLRGRMPHLPAPALAAMSDRLEAERRCRLRLARLERERIIDEEAAAAVDSVESPAAAAATRRWNSSSALDRTDPPPPQPQQPPPSVRISCSSPESFAPVQKSGSDRCLDYRDRPAPANFSNGTDVRRQQDCGGRSEVGEFRGLQREPMGGSEPQLWAGRRRQDDDDRSLKPAAAKRFQRAAETEESEPDEEEVHGAAAYGRAGGWAAMGGSEPQLFSRSSGGLRGSGLRRRDSGRRWERKRRTERLATNGVSSAAVMQRKSLTARASPVKYTDEAAWSKSSLQTPLMQQAPTAMLQRLELLRVERFQASSDRRHRLESEIDDFRREMRRLRLLAERRTLDAAERGLRAMRAS
ncbi:hypothetical protein BOX15_Mlig026785g1 [Macrostomum lignano]|uniref:Uncharacterized protein n=2 Tax=Macrostomum lignano TaxID=282301 RepID=A0A267GU43_9PLAT|nr:hypothetical protein BOX15_Mlig026785g1 [Macrostomum lignano]